MMIPILKPEPIYDSGHYSVDDILSLLREVTSGVIFRDSYSQSVRDYELLKKYWEEGWTVASVGSISSIRYIFQMSYFLYIDQFLTYYILYCLPLEFMPLLINEEYHYVRRIAQWRLSHGK